MEHKKHPDVYRAFAHWYRAGMEPITPLYGYINMLRMGVLGPLTPEQQQVLDVMVPMIKRERVVWSVASDYIHTYFAPKIREAIPLAALVEDMHRYLEPVSVVCEIDLPEPWPLIEAHGGLSRAFAHLIYPIDERPDYHQKTPFFCARLHESNLQLQLRSTIDTQTTDEQLQEWFAAPGTCLQVAALIIEQHGGQIARERAAEGWLFTVTLPLYSPDATATTENNQA